MKTKFGAAVDHEVAGKLKSILPAYIPHCEHIFIEHDTNPNRKQCTYCKIYQPEGGLNVWKRSAGMLW